MQSVFHQDNQHLLHPPAIADTLIILSFFKGAGKADFLLFCSLLIFLIYSFHKFRQTDQFKLKGHLCPFHFYQTQKILYQMLHSGHFAVHQSKNPLLLFHVMVFSQHGQPCFKYCQGRTEFMGGKGNKVLLLFLILFHRFQHAGRKPAGKTIDQRD